MHQPPYAGRSLETISRRPRGPSAGLAPPTSYDIAAPFSIEPARGAAPIVDNKRSRRDGDHHPDEWRFGQGTGAAYPGLSQIRDVARRSQPLPGERAWSETQRGQLEDVRIYDRVGESAREHHGDVGGGTQLEIDDCLFESRTPNGESAGRHRARSGNGLVGGWRLDGEDIEGGAGDPALLDRPGKSILVDQRAA